METTTVMCGECAKLHPENSAGTIEQWELPGLGKMKCAICGEDYGPVRDFKSVNYYKLPPSPAESAATDGYTPDTHNSE